MPCSLRSSSTRRRFGRRFLTEKNTLNEKFTANKAPENGWLKDDPLLSWQVRTVSFREGMDDNFDS